jgi:hypothetical protein
LQLKKIGAGFDLSDRTIPLLDEMIKINSDVTDVLIVANITEEMLWLQQKWEKIKELEESFFHICIALANTDIFSR